MSNSRLLWQVQDPEKGTCEWVDLGELSPSEITSEVRKQLSTMLEGEVIAVTNWNFARVYCESCFGNFTACGSTLQEAEARMNQAFVDYEREFNNRAFIGLDSQGLEVFGWKNRDQVKFWPQSPYI